MEKWLRLGVLVFVLPLMALSGCKRGNLWQEVAKECSDRTALDGETVLYFGPSNNLGPGSVWRLASAEAGGPRYRARRDENFVPRDPSWLRTGEGFACDAKKESKVSGELVAKFSSELAPLNASSTTDFSSAKTVTFKAGELRWDSILEGNYEDAIKKLPGGHPVREEFAAERLVLHRALRITGFEAKMSFDKATGEKLEAKYKNGTLLKLNGDFGAALSINWANSTELTLKSPNAFYVAGEFSKWGSGGAASASKALTRLTTLPTVESSRSVGIETN